MIELSLQGFSSFKAVKDKKAIRSWMRDVGDESKKAFEKGMRNGPHSGLIYRRKGGGFHQASAAGEYPANNSGNLISTIKTRDTAESVTIGSNAHYSGYLAGGTSKMEPRKMSHAALLEGITKAHLMGWVKWTR